MQDVNEADANSDSVNVLHNNVMDWSHATLRSAAILATNRAITQTGFQTLSRDGPQEMTVVLGSHPDLPAGHHFKVAVKLIDRQT
jgi:hypothetical protein